MPTSSWVTDCDLLQSSTNAFYYLLSHPEYIEPLRHDVETAVAEEGWTKAGMGKMLKLDSFFRESQRISGPGICPLGYRSRTSVTDALFFHLQWGWAVSHYVRSHFPMGSLFLRVQGSPPRLLLST